MESVGIGQKSLGQLIFGQCPLIFWPMPTDFGPNQWELAKISGHWQKSVGIGQCPLILAKHWPKTQWALAKNQWALAKTSVYWPEISGHWPKLIGPMPTDLGQNQWALAKTDFGQCPLIWAKISGHWPKISGHWPTLFWL